MSAGAEAKRLYDEGLAAFRRGDQAGSLALNERALAIARSDGDDVNVVRALVGLARVAFRDGDHDRVTELAQECMPIFERLPDKTLVTSPVHMLAESARADGRLDEAREFYQENIGISRSADDARMIAVEYMNLGLLEAMSGDTAAATRYSLDAIGSEEFEDGDLPYALLALGAAAEIDGDVDRAVVLLAASARMVADAGGIFDPADEPIYRERIDSARAKLGPERFAALEEKGRSLDAAQARAIAVGEDAE